MTKMSKSLSIHYVHNQLRYPWLNLSKLFTYGVFQLRFKKISWVIMWTTRSYGQTNRQMQEMTTPIWPSRLRGKKHNADSDVGTCTVNFGCSCPKLYDTVPRIPSPDEKSTLNEQCSWAHSNCNSSDNNPEQVAELTLCGLSMPHDNMEHAAGNGLFPEGLGTYASLSLRPCRIHWREISQETLEISITKMGLNIAFKITAIPLRDQWVIVEPDKASQVSTMTHDPFN